MLVPCLWAKTLMQNKCLGPILPEEYVNGQDGLAGSDENKGLSVILPSHTSKVF